MLLGVLLPRQNKNGGSNLTNTVIIVADITWRSYQNSQKQANSKKTRQFEVGLLTGWTVFMFHVWEHNILKLKVEGAHTLKTLSHTICPQLYIKVGWYSEGDSDATDLRCRFQHRSDVSFNIASPSQRQCTSSLTITSGHFRRKDHR
jgi:hypothetical protein